jgi:hypothetical protein
MASASAPVTSSSAWKDELDTIKATITRIYTTDYKVWYDEWTTPASSPYGGLGRTRANPSPWTYYNEVNLNLSTLYASAVALACKNGTYNDLVELLVFLNNISPEAGRDLYASGTILYSTLISQEDKTKCAYAYMAGMFKDKFNFDIVADDDRGNVGVIMDKLVARAPALNCKSLPLIAAYRVVIFPVRYSSLAANASALDSSPWVHVAHSLVHAATTSDADTLVAMMKAVE